jgi:hypothetical protein
MTQMQLAKRVEQLEREMRLLKQKVDQGGKQLPARNAEDFFGMFHGDPHFKRAMQYGAAYRRSLRPRDTARRSRKK